jgi:UDP-N-acetylmuramoylalanine--D-glutamate ligase
LNVGLAGNVGKSFARQVAEENFDYYVLELSSFQLDGCFNFKADVAILTNITPDHLDRYDYNLQKYIDSKFRIIQNQGPSDAFIYCADDMLTGQEITKREFKMQCFPFSINQKNGMNAYVENNNLIIQTHNQTLNMSIQELALQGKHNLYNSMASGIASRILEIRKEVVRESFSDFENIEHRLEFVNSVHGIDFINDSLIYPNVRTYSLSLTNKKKDRMVKNFTKIILLYFLVNKSSSYSFNTRIWLVWDVKSTSFCFLNLLIDYFFENSFFF